jgi:hypothetical protein
LPGARRNELSAICLIVAKLAGACCVRTRHSSSQGCNDAAHRRNLGNGGDHVTACPDEMAETGAKTPASCLRTGQYQRTSPPQPAPPTGLKAAPRPADISLWTAGERPANPENDPDIQPPRSAPQRQNHGYPSPQSPTSSEDRHRFSTLPVCHAFIHPIALLELILPLDLVAIRAIRAALDGACPVLTVRDSW